MAESATPDGNAGVYTKFGEDILVNWNLEDEDGTAGYFGMTPVFFCPFCLSSMVDMVEKLFENK